MDFATILSGTKCHFQSGKEKHKFLISTILQLTQHEIVSFYHLMFVLTVVCAMMMLPLTVTLMMHSSQPGSVPVDCSVENSFAVPY